MDRHKVDVKECLSKDKFSTIISGLSEEFGCDLTPDEEKLNRLLEVIPLYLAAGHFNKASRLLKELLLVAPNLKIQLVEFELLVRSRAHDYNGQKRIVEQLLEDRDELTWYPRYPWTSEIVGCHLIDKHQFEEGLLIINNALTKALEDYDVTNEEDNNYITRLQGHIADGETKKQDAFEKNKQAEEKRAKEREKRQRKKERNKKGIPEEEEKEKEEEGEAVKEVVEEKNIDVLAEEFAEYDREKQKKKKKGRYNKWNKPKKEKEENKEGNNENKGGNKKEEKKEGKNENEEEEKKVEEVLERKTDEEKESTSEEPLQLKAFEVLMRVIPQRVCDRMTRRSYGGLIEINGVLLEKSFIGAQPIQIEKSKELVSLTCRHPGLLRVENVIGGYVITEPAYKVETFFQLKLEALSPQPKSNKEWWEEIRDLFWQIFRDVLRGLMFLFNQNLSCGDVTFNVYVTQDEERGRILPSMEHLKHSLEARLDLQNLRQIMEGIIKLGCPLDVGDSHIPDDLKEYFVLIGETKSRLKNVPVLFLADFPYFLNVKEKVDFIKKTRDLFKKRRAKLSYINKVMVKLKCCKDWVSKPTGAYREVFNFAKNKKPYKTSDDVVRYCGAVFTHVNDPDYDAFRVKKYLNNDEIERDLLLYFPDYYRGIIKCLCVCVEDGILSPDDLMEVCTVYYKQS